MPRHEETRSALLKILRTFGEAPTGLFLIGVPMVDQGFSQDEILNALMSLDREKAIELGGLRRDRTGSCDQKAEVCLTTELSSPG
ncbi:hypothetical protein [Pararhizobium sp. PWRC1-1]|uniref:hypothetical protein n=1 Tax=Pararhizobium sp. PWRC1-1 TaxID=2804566 RepID=UPI003CF3970C